VDSVGRAAGAVEGKAEPERATRPAWPVPLRWLAVAAFVAAALALADRVAAGLGAGPGGTALAARWAIDAAVALAAAALASRLAPRDRAAPAPDLSGVEERAEWSAALDAIPELVLVTDRDGRIVRANAAFARAAGATAGEIAGRRLADVFAGHPDGWWSSPPDGIVELEDPVLDGIFEISSTRLGERVVRVARDVGEERRLHGRLVQADKLAAVGVLASGIAFEMNNPTAFVSSNLAELRRYVEAYEGAVRSLEAVAGEAGRAEAAGAIAARPDVAFARREAPKAVVESLEGMERIRHIVASLRSLARREPAGEPPAPVDLSDVVQAVVRTAGAELRGAAARVDVRGPVWVVGHRGELVDVVLNLVVNAVQARDEGRPNRVAIELFREGPRAVVAVTDTGRGIAPAHMKRLFEPFFTTKPAGEGTGLGLSLARKIVLAHGGSIDVASEPGSGTTFTVSFPAAEAPPAEAAPGAGRA
jgi:signal transduction histidine kinase